MSFAILLIACGGGQAPPVGTVAPSEAAQLYGRYCALCHGASGEGYAADNATRLRGQGFLSTASDDLIALAIARGRTHTAMAGYHERFGGPLSDEQVERLVTFIREWQTEPALALSAEPATGDSENGAVLFGRHCASCHGRLGQGGDTAQSVTSFTFLSEASDAFLRYAIVHGREETEMSAYAERLGAQQIEDIVVFLRRFEEEADVVPRYMAPPDLARMTVIRNERGPTPELTLREGRFVSALQVRDALAASSRIILLDARPTSDWLIERLPGALPVPYYDIEPIIARLPRDGTWIVAYCGCPHAASGEVVDALQEAGFEHTAVLDEGVFHWIEEGYPTEEGPLDPAQL